MESVVLRKKFLEFFTKKKHKIVPSSSLLPTDNTVLLSTAGMQQFKEYLRGEKDVQKDFGSKRLASVQKCFRTGDIERVGDNTHHTFFEMLGNFSVGDYFKEETIKYAWEFLTKELKLNTDNLWVTVFKGESSIPRDDEAMKIWKDIVGVNPERILEFNSKENFWGPVSETGLCGPSSEIFYDRGKDFYNGNGKCNSNKCGPNCSCGRFVEIWNLVFMEYNKNEKAEFELLSQKNIDTGIGFERLVSILQNKCSAYETDLFFSIIQKIDELSPESYDLNPKPYRIVADHIRGICFLIADGVSPSNVEQGYVLRRVLRRAIRYSKILELPPGSLITLSKEVIKVYKKVYPGLISKQEQILTVIQNEEEKFSNSLERGLVQFEKLIKNKIEEQGEKIIDGEEVFDLYQNYGFPLELTKELALERGYKIDEENFHYKEKEHQEISRKGVDKKFGGHGIKETSDSLVIKDSLSIDEQRDRIKNLHTATHLLHSALRETLGPEVRQMGSDINEERLRFDFSFSRKITEQEIKEVEDLVNKQIKENLKVEKEETSYKKAVRSGALAFFREKYPEKVCVYSIGPDKKMFSKEICAGPHAEKTGDLGEFKIIKEESSSAGVRRIKATIN